MENRDLDQLRKEIDSVDNRLCELFKERMEIISHVAEYKKEMALPVSNKLREREVLAKVSKQLGEELEVYGRTLYRTIFDLSKSYETKLMGRKTPLYETLSQLVNAKPVPFPKRATVACQGCEGAYSQMAAEHLFEVPEIMFNNSFEGVFKAVGSGLCEYGILPIENSTAGSVNEIYDNLVRHNVYIVRSVRIKIDHSLLGLPNTKLSDIKTIYSHQQAINQCSNFLDTLKGVRIIPCENTAVAAKKVATENNPEQASLSSRICAELYGLKSIVSGAQNQDNNYTRFICITKEPKIFPGADRTSIMMVIPNKAGMLFSVLSKFNAMGANLVKLESRPIPNRDFEFVFYFDIEASIYDDKFTSLICELEDIGEQFSYLGTYTEII